MACQHSADRDVYLQERDKAQPNSREQISRWPFSRLCSQAGEDRAGWPAATAPHSILPFLFSSKLLSPPDRAVLWDSGAPGTPAWAPLDG